MKYYLYLFGVIFLSSCSLWEEDDEEMIQPFAIESITVNGISRTEILFTVFNGCGSMCWKRTYVESSINNFDVYVKTLAVFDRSSVCPEVCVETKTPVSIHLTSNGTYTFHFWQSDSASLDTTIIVN